MAQLLRKGRTRWSSSLREEWTAAVYALSAPRLGEGILSQGNGSLLLRTYINGGRNFVPDGDDSGSDVNRGRPSADLDLRSTCATGGYRHHDAKRYSTLCGKLGAFARVGGLPSSQFFAGFMVPSIRNGSSQWSHGSFNSKWRSFMSLDHDLNVLKDDIKTSSESFIENSKAMEELLLDLQQKVEKVRLQIRSHIRWMDFYIEKQLRWPECDPQ